MVGYLNHRKLFPAFTGGQGIIYGANAFLTLTFEGTVGGGIWRLSGTPTPDPMEVRSLAATLETNGGCAPVPGARILLGQLTGLPGSAVSWIRDGILGTNGEYWVRALTPFVSKFGLVAWIPPMLTSGDYVAILEGSLWKP